MANVTENDQYHSIFSTHLRELLEEREIKQEELAKACGVKRQTIAQWKDGKTKPDTNGIAAIAKFFHVSSDYLLGLSEVRTPSTNVQAICEYTGLSEKAVSLLHETKQFQDEENEHREAEGDGEAFHNIYLDNINRLLTSDIFSLVLSEMEHAIYSAQACTEEHEINEYLSEAALEEVRMWRLKTGGVVMGAHTASLWHSQRAGVVLSALIDEIINSEIKRREDSES